MSRRGTPLATSIPSLAASNQAQIDDLVQRNRTLEHTNKKLSDQLALESARAKDAVADIQKQWQLEQREWREGCDVLQSCHRLVQLRSTAALEKERMGTLRELDALRREKAVRLQRDFRLTLFQIRETELEMRIAEIQDEREELVVSHEEVVRKLKGKYAECAAQLTAGQDRLEVAEQERRELQERLTQLHEEHTRLQTSAESSMTKYERTKLQLDGAQTKYADLERTNGELKRTNAELNRQLEQWQTLETKGGAEVEALRKRRLELENRVKELEEELEKNSEDHERDLAKEQRKVEKLKRGIDEWTSEATKQEQEKEETEKQLAKAQKQLERLEINLEGREELEQERKITQKELVKAQKQVEKLKAELEDERARVRPPSPKRSMQKPKPLMPEISEEEVANEVEVDQPPTPPPAAKPAKARLQPRPVSKRTKVSDNVLGSSADRQSQEEEVEEVPKPAKTRGRGKAPDSDIEVVQPPGRRGRPKSKAPPPIEEGDIQEIPKKGRGKGKTKAIVEMDEPEAETQGQDEDEEPPALPPAKNKGKRKAPSRDEGADSDIQVVASPVRARKGANRAPSEPRETTAKSRRARAGTASRATSQSKPPAITIEEDVQVVDDEDEEPSRKKKKRKINIFPTSAEPTSFNFMPQGNDGGLNIPTFLSPVKETDAIPSRSTSGSVIGNIKSLLSSSFTNRR